MKKIAATVALSALFFVGTIDNTEASIFTRNNKSTRSQLEEAFGSGVVGGSFPSYKNDTHVLYDALVKARKIFESTVKTYKLNKDADVKTFIESLKKIEEALDDIYKSKKDSAIIEKASAARDYYDQNSNAYPLVKEKMGAALQPFEASFQKLTTRQLTNPNGDLSSATNDTFDIIREMQEQMVEEKVAPQPQQTIIVVPAAAQSINTSSSGNWMFDNPNQSVQNTVAQSTAVVQQPIVQPQTTPAKVTTTPVVTQQSNVVQQPAAVVQQPIVQPQQVVVRGAGRNSNGR